MWQSINIDINGKDFQVEQTLVDYVRLRVIYFHAENGKNREKQLLNTYAV